MELLRPILELGVVIPGMLLAYFPVKSSLKQPLSKLVLWLAPLLALLCAAGGVVCYAHRVPTAPVLAGLTLLAAVIYIKTLRISLWKSGTVALSVCAVFACINSLCRAINAAMLAGLPQAQAAPWFCLRAVICYHAICWLFAAIAYYPATHSVRKMVEDENFAQTWYVFWVLPLVFIALNLFMIPKYADTLYTGRVLQGYFVISIALLFLMLFFDAIFLLTAISINRNVRLQQENQLLFMQQQRYESLKGVQANPQHLSGFFTLNQFIHHQNSLPFGICLVFFSPPVREYNIQAALSQLHQFRASAPYLPYRDTESHRSYHMYQAAPPIPSKILPALLPSEGNNVLAGFFSFESSLSEEQP